MSVYILLSKVVHLVETFMRSSRSLWHDELTPWGQPQTEGSPPPPPSSTLRRPITGLLRPPNVRVSDQSGGAARSQRGQRAQIKCLTPIHPLKPSSQSSQDLVRNLCFDLNSHLRHHTQPDPRPQQLLSGVKASARPGGNLLLKVCERKDHYKLKKKCVAWD